MKNKNIVPVFAAGICVIAAVVAALFINKNIGDNSQVPIELKSDTEHTANAAKTHQKAEKSDTIRQKQILKASAQKEDSLSKHTNLYEETSSSALPLSVISELSGLPHNIQSAVEKIAQNSNIFMMQKNNDRIILITDNPSNIRHNVEFTEIVLSNGHQTQTTLGYSDKMNDSDNDIWDYTPETQQPLRHTKYNKDGDVEFTEVWNYDSNEPIKYEMKDSEGRVISLRKETSQGDTDLRVEHLVYDKDGNTKINVSTTYDGEDIKRFTYYNADKPNISGSIFSDYSDGLKTKESVYTSDLKLKEVYTSEYKDGVREEIIKWNNQNQEVQKLIPAE